MEWKPTPEEIRALRAEVQALRQQNNELILGFDSSLDQAHRRLGSLESRQELPAGSPTLPVETGSR